MNHSMIRYILSYVLIFEGAFLLLPCLVAVIYGESAGWYYLLVAGVCVLLGLLGKIKKQPIKFCIPVRDLFLYL